MEGEISKKRNVLLLGAGAAISWGGPSTSQVTDLILGRLEPDTARNTDLNFTNLIYNFLHIKYSQDPTYKEAKINFEDIINVVEELILFYYEEEKEGGKHILPHFFDIKPDFKRDLEACFKNEETIYENLLGSLRDIFSSISSRVHRYSWHYSDANFKILPCEQHIDLCGRNERSYLIGLFHSWAIKIGLDQSFIRAYTLNYDKLYKVLFEDFLNRICETGAEIFEGFKNNSPLARDIIFKRNQHCHFNLHGSIYWHPIEKNTQALPDSHFIIDNAPYSRSEGGTSMVELEQGKPFLNSNIIAGFKKMQRSFISPFKQMHASFEMDCLDGDEIYIIGYSFSDLHINAGLKSALAENQKLKIYIIDPSFTKDSFRKLVTEVFPVLYKEERFVNGENQGIRIPHEYLDKKINIYPLTFEQYLKFENGLV